MIKNILNQYKIKPAKPLNFDFSDAVRLDLSKKNQELTSIDLDNEEAFSRFIFDQIPEGNIGMGGYGEERDLYRRSELFTEGEQRTIHLGIDFWTFAGTPVFAPLEGQIHSLANRAVHGDYGPVIILKHQFGERSIYSLYGHLSRGSLQGKVVGQDIRKGENFAWLGEYEENFHWPPHLHFQLMWDMQGHVGDYPGVCKASEKEGYLANCPDPELLF